jgi:hypothetical protein
MTIDDELLAENDAASILGAAKSTLKQSRHTGKLFGKPAPPYLKLGLRSIRYKRSDLLNSRDQFQEFRSTSEY